MAKKTVVKDNVTSIKGEVVVSTYKGTKLVTKKKMHNNAVANMLIGIARFLRGDFLHLGEESKSCLPLYLGVGFTNAVAVTQFDAKSLASELSSYTYRFDISKGDISIDTTNNQVRLSLSAVIPSGTFVSGTEINEIGLFSQRATKSSGLLARVVYLTDAGRPATSTNDSTGKNHIIIKTGMSERIDWTIILSNK